MCARLAFRKKIDGAHTVRPSIGLPRSESVFPAQTTVPGGSTAFFGTTSTPSRMITRPFA